MTSKGIKDYRIFRALYTLTNDDGEVILMLGAHVDDLIWACEPEAQRLICELLESFQCRKVEEGKLPYCGKDIEQDDDYNIFGRLQRQYYEDPKS